MGAPHPINSQQNSARQGRRTFPQARELQLAIKSQYAVALLLFTCNIVYRLCIHPSSSYIICNVRFPHRQPRRVYGREEELLLIFVNKRGLSLI